MQRLSVSFVVVAVALGGLGACGGDDAPGPTFADDHPRIYLERNRERLTAALEAGEPAALRFREIVDLQVREGADLYDFQGWFAALIGQLTGDPVYCEYAVGLVDEHVAAEEALIGGGEPPRAARDSYLEVGAFVGDVMLTYDWCFDQASVGQRSRWLAYARQAVWNVWHHEEATWGAWSGWSVDNPSNNYYYSFLRATMMFGLAAHGEDAEAAGALAFFRDTKIGGQLIPTFERDLVGGGSREGTGYGVAMMRLWEIYDVWQGSTGEDLARLNGHARSSMLSMIHQTVPTRDRIAPIGDHSRDSTAQLFDYHRHYLQTLSYLFSGDAMVPPAKFFLSHSSVPEMGEVYNYVYDFLYGTPDIAEQPMDGLGRAFHGTGTGQLYARSSWDPGATWLSLIAGPYTESHAHHDQGSFMIFKEGWLAQDANLDSTSGLRWEEEAHNLVRISRDGATIEQEEGTTSEVVALGRGDGWLHVAADLTPAYDGNPAVTRVHRELVYLEPDVIVVFDRVATAADTEQTWQLNVPARPALSGARASITGDAHTLRSERIVPSAADAAVHDWTDDGDVTAGFRLDETIAGGDNVLLHVLWLDSAVTAVTRSDGDGRTGVTITLAGGAAATVRFGADGVDGTLDLGGGTVALSSGVAALPE